MNIRVIVILLKYIKFLLLLDSKMKNIIITLLVYIIVCASTLAFDVHDTCLVNKTSIYKNFNISSLPMCNIMASCSDLPDPQCTYTLPPNCMLQYAFSASSQPFRFDIKSSGGVPLYIDYGPDSHHIFAGSCCQSSSGSSSCAVRNVYSWSYFGSCSVACPTYAAVANLGNQAVNVAIYGRKPM